jgi:hypothetical protein
MGLVASAWEGGTAPRLGRPLAAVLAANLFLYTLTSLPGLMVLRDLGVTAYGALLLWTAAVVVLRKRARGAGSAGASLAGRAAA